MTKRPTRKTPRRGASDRLTPAVQRSNRRIEAMEKRASRNSAQRKRSALERELLDAFSKFAERQFAAMAKRVDQTNRRLDRLFRRLDRLKDKERRPPAYEADDGPLTDRQVRALRKRAAPGHGGGKKHRKVRTSLF